MLDEYLYRGGILLHGTDLGYDNIDVAAKTWAALFAVGEWARKIERGDGMEPEAKPEVTWDQLLAQIAQNDCGQRKQGLQVGESHMACIVKVTALTKVTGQCLNAYAPIK